jgi:tryptophan synthase alpha chain
MSRISSTFAALQRAGRKALIPYITAGDPDPAVTVAIMHGMVEAGADIVELGVPFSDPMADGPVIQRAGERALAKGVTLTRVLQMARDFRATNQTTPIVLMGYANPIEALGRERFVREAAQAGVDGVVVVDLPPEEGAAFAAQIKAAGMDLIFLLAPTTTASRMDEIVKLASGYLYYVSLTGVTGAAHLDTAGVAKQLAVVRKHTSLPIGVGFGIRDGATARAISEVADAVIIGSRLIQEVESATSATAAERVGAFLRSMRQAMDRRQ